MHKPSQQTYIQHYDDSIYYNNVLIKTLVMLHRNYNLPAKIYRPWGHSGKKYIKEYYIKDKLLMKLYKIHMGTYMGRGVPNGGGLYRAICLFKTKQKKERIRKYDLFFLMPL